MSAPAPHDPLANKSIVAAVGTIVTVLLRWAVSGEFSLTDEGLVALAGAITSVAVYSVSNYRRLLGLRSERGLTTLELIGVLCLAGIIALLTLALL